MDARFNLLVISTDASYARGAAVAAISAITHYAGEVPLRIRILFFGSKDYEFEMLVASTAELPVDVQQNSTVRFRGLPNHRFYGGDAAYARLFIQHFCEAGEGRVVYCDADTMINTDISPLWEVDLGGCSVGAVREMYAPVVSEPSGLSRYADLGLAPHTKYFNSGVLVFDLAAWIGGSFTAKAVELLQTYDFRYPDQDAMNACLYGQWRELNPRYNCTSFWDWKEYYSEIYGDVRSEAAIYHFSGGRKPWKPDYPWSDRQVIFDSHFARTAWAKQDTVGGPA